MWNYPHPVTVGRADCSVGQWSRTEVEGSAAHSALVSYCVTPMPERNCVASPVALCNNGPVMVCTAIPHSHGRQDTVKVPTATFARLLASCCLELLEIHSADRVGSA